MKLLRRFDVRLFVGFLLAILTAVVLFVVTLRILGPAFFDRQLGGLGRGAARNRPEWAGAASDAFLTSLVKSMWIAAAGALVVAGGLAVAASRRLSKPLSTVRMTLHRIGGGDLSAVVPASGITELDDLASDVNHLAARLAESEQRRVALISDVTHEMRTPLATIDGYAEGLIDGVFEDHEEALGRIQAETARLRRLSEDLSALSQAEEIGITLEVRRVDLARLAVAVVERLDPQFEHAHVGLRVEAAGPAWVDGDADRLVQILTNLVGNALAYTPEGGEVTVRVYSGPTTHEVEVADTGIGIAPDEIDRIFERFYRAVPAGHARGTGIGLTIARTFARAHGGDVVATSAGPGSGSTFTLSLPADPGRE